MRFTIHPHPEHARLRHIEIAQDALQAFFEETAAVDVQNLEYLPFMRFMLADKLATHVGGNFAEALHKLLLERASGGFTLGVQGVVNSAAEYVKFGTAVSHLLGTANHDAMSNAYYARFLVKDTDSSDSYLRQAYRLFTLHTDGTFVEEATDWLLMMKFAEDNAVGGESRLLHLDDWEELDQFAMHPLGTYPFIYKAPGSKNVQAEVERPTFVLKDSELCISFIDQFAQPQTREEARYLHDLSASMEHSPGTKEIPLPVGDLVVLNNDFWLHGRAPFKKHAQLHRELMRIRGSFTAV